MQCAVLSGIVCMSSGTLGHAKHTCHTYFLYFRGCILRDEFSTEQGHQIVKPLDETQTHDHWISRPVLYQMTYHAAELTLLGYKS